VATEGQAVHADVPLSGESSGSQRDGHTTVVASEAGPQLAPLSHTLAEVQVPQPVWQTQAPTPQRLLLPPTEPQPLSPLQTKKGGGSACVAQFWDAQM
jgi:hypothetical protein